MGQTSKRLTIFEGPDGAGKSTAAKVYAERTGARYVHFPALPRVRQSLGRMYVEAMLPALLGYQDVVFDRSWLSEMPYGIAFREGADRLSSASRRMLERLAFRCGAVVVHCDPGWDVIQHNFMKRKHLEMLDDTSQLKMVYDLYCKQGTDLPSVVFDYRSQLNADEVINDISRAPLHPLSVQSAGNMSAFKILVGEDFAERKDQDSFYQWPFGSFSGEGCSQWLTNQLDTAEVSEDQLMWVNSDQNLGFLFEFMELSPSTQVFALGAKAAAVLYADKIEAVEIPHPQAWKRFNNKQTYPLLKHI